jgi:hypothetical protein
VSKWAKVLSSKPLGSIYREEETVVYIYSIGGVKYYKWIPRNYKGVLGLANRPLNTATKSLDLINKPLDQ